MNYCKRLIEIDLPIKTISENARKEKEIRRGPIPMIHNWWAARPPSACRAVILATLLPDPCDSACSDKFRKDAKAILGRLSQRKIESHMDLRDALLKFIGDFSSWELAINQSYVEVARDLIKAFWPDTPPEVCDFFAGGGAIPLEALRVGAHSVASDLNPVAVLINKVILEYVPKYGSRIIGDIDKLVEYVKDKSSQALSKFYPEHPEGLMPVGYIWARTINCEGPSCGVEIPLLRSCLLARKRKPQVFMKLIPNKKEKQIDVEIVEGSARELSSSGTVMRGSVTCPICSYTTPVASVRKQLKARHGGTHSSRLMAVVFTHPNRPGRIYKKPSSVDLGGIKLAKETFSKKASEKGSKNIFPSEELPLMSGVFNVPIYGMNKWGFIFTERQLLMVNTYIDSLREARNKIEKITQNSDPEYHKAVVTILALSLDKMIALNCALCTWQTHAEIPANVFGRQALGMVWDFVEAAPLANSSGSLDSAIKRTKDCLKDLTIIKNEGVVLQASAQKHPYPDDSIDALVTDPPYYNAVPYADLSDFFYVWLKRSIGDLYPELLSKPLSPKDDELCEMSGWDPVRYNHKDKNFYEDGMRIAFSDGRRILKHDGIGVVVFAHKTTAGWESLLKGLVNAGWYITASWPIDTEMRSRLRAKNSAALASSIHLVCRPREDENGILITNSVGDWRDVVTELPKRIHEWMPRLAQEGVVGADAIFACLGPALEIFSRYSCVEKANGEKVDLKEYLEQVWAVVAKEALNMIFEGARTEGFEEDARLTAMWFWTLSTGSDSGSDDAKEIVEEDDSETGGGVKTSGFSLEFDAARKIAQGLGAHLENLSSVIEVDGDQARLLPVAERVNYLFGKGSMAATPAKKKKKENQMTLFEEFNKVEEQGWSLGDEKSAVGKTILDRLHQAMILFGAGRGDAMRRFLVEEGIGKDERFWRLAQAFSALYPSNTDEKRWVDGVLARKKSLGF